MTCAVVVAAGSSARMGFDKLAADLGGQSVLARSVLAFLQHPEITQVILVAPEARAVALREEITRINLPATAWERLTCVRGGARRQDSVLAGLSACPAGTAWVAVHDAARPLLAEADLTRTLAAARAHGGAVLAAPVADSLLRAACPADSTDLPQVLDAVSRQDLWAAQTPQCFRLTDLRRALEQCAATGVEVTDEVAAARALGLPVAVVPATQPNFKLTNPADLALARALLGVGRG